jgi:hypothetical protein
MVSRHIVGPTGHVTKYSTVPAGEGLLDSTVPLPTERGLLDSTVPVGRGLLDSMVRAKRGLLDVRHL